MRGRMMEMPLLVSSLIEHAGRVHASRDIVGRTATGGAHRGTWGEVRARAKRLAGALEARGLRVGDRLGTLAWNTHRHLEIYYGVSGMGGVCHTLNPRLHPSQLVYILRHAEDRVVFVDPPFVPLLEAVADQVPVESYVVLGSESELPESSLPGLVSYEALLAEHDGAYEWPALDEHAAASLCYTSGTTGNPKGVLYSHRSTVLHAYGVIQPDVFDLGRSETVLPIVPMFHANAWGLPYAAAAVGAKIVMPGPRLDPEGLTEQLVSEGVTMCAGVPSVFIPLIGHWRAKGMAKPPAMKMMLLGGSAPPRSLIEAIEDLEIEFRHAWGMTEMSPLGSTHCLTPEQRARPVRERSKHHVKQGRPPFGVQVRIVDESGSPLPHDGVAFGELQVRGPWVVDGYYKEEGSSRLTKDGWFPTGDVVTIDDTCCIQVTDRTKDLIKSGGEWISSIDVENAAMGHPGITMAAVIGVPHERWGERPLLIAVAATDPVPTRASVLEHLRCSLADWQLPDEIVFVDALPMGATGKVQKTKLREQYAGS